MSRNINNILSYLTGIAVWTEVTLISVRPWIKHVEIVCQSHPSEEVATILVRSWMKHVKTSFQITSAHKTRIISLKITFSKHITSTIKIATRFWQNQEKHETSNPDRVLKACVILSYYVKLVWQFDVRKKGFDQNSDLQWGASNSL